MPIMDLSTNIPGENIPADFDLKLCEVVGEVLKKPLERITLTINAGRRQIRAGSSAPMVSLQIHSINVFDEERNPNYTPPLVEFICGALNLTKDRVVIIFYDLLKHHVAQDPK